MMAWILVMELNGIDGLMIREYSNESECKEEMSYIESHSKNTVLDLKRVYCIKSENFNQEI